MARRPLYKQVSAFENTNRHRVARGVEPIPTVNPFKATFNMFREYLGYVRPLTYSEWMEVDPEDKAAVLYVQFYDQITLAWYKSRSFYAQEEDGVSTMMQYLIKNVPVLEKDPKRFSERYIYRVAYNCLYCICHDIKVDKDRYELETSNIQATDGDDEVDLFNLVQSNFSIQTTINKEKFWAVVMSMDDDVLTFVDCLINKTRFPAGMKAKSASYIEKLRVALKDFQDMEY